MITDGKNITTPQTAQVCVIGSGPAGVTAAWELSKAGLDVILLDGGRQVPYQQSFGEKVKLYNGVADGVFSVNERDFLIRPYTGQTGTPRERERVYGGTSTHWGGQSRPFDPIDFENRPGFPGWPITRQELDPYYAKTSTFNHLFGDYVGKDGEQGANFSAEFWTTQIPNAAVPHLKNFDAEMYQFMGPQWLNFATRTFDGTTIGNSAVRVIVNANLLNIVEQGGSVRCLEIASLNDDQTNPQKATEFTVTADLYILACGAVANARQLLLSGVGNNLVGRYFMCHPLSRSGIIQTTRTYLSDEEQTLMNGAGWSDPTGNINGVEGRFITDANATRGNGIGRCWFWARSQGFSSSMYFEMAPNYDSYVTLDQTPDPVFGQKQARIHWAFTALDKKTYETNCSLFNSASSKYPSIISWPSWDSITTQWIVNGHHIGTTRMSASADPREGGVVDKNLKVHGVDNLYVAGSSVFPSAGISNPTMTIITLSIRLAEHVLLAQIKPRAQAKAQ
jgi:choline dehydrogenase-like flavoprotein